MKRSIVAAMLLLLIPAFATAQQDQQTPLDQIKPVMAVKLKDAESARYLNVVKSADSSAVCGWLDSKNSFGAYSGYEAFFVVGDILQIYSGDGGVFNGIWRDCFPPTSEQFGTASLKLPRIDIAKECAKNRAQSQDKPHLYAKCEQREAEDQAWLEAYKTSQSIASDCAVEARRYRSYVMTKTCVLDEETDIVIQRGPRIGKKP